MLHSSSCQAHLDKKHPCSQAFSCLPACVCVCVCTYEIYLHVCVRWCTLRYCVYRQKAAGAENAIYFSCIASGLHEISQKTTIVILSEKKTHSHTCKQNKKKGAWSKTQCLLILCSLIFSCIYASAFTCAPVSVKYVRVCVCVCKNICGDCAVTRSSGARLVEKGCWVVQWRWKMAIMCIIHKLC